MKLTTIKKTDQTTNLDKKRKKKQIVQKPLKPKNPKTIAKTKTQLDFVNANRLKTGESPNKNSNQFFVHCTFITYIKTNCCLNFPAT